MEIKTKGLAASVEKVMRKEGMKSALVYKKVEEEGDDGVSEGII